MHKCSKRHAHNKLLRSALEWSKQSIVSVATSVLLSTANQAIIREVMKIIAKDFSRIRDLTLDINSTVLLEEWTPPALALCKLCINNRGPCTPLTTMFVGYIPQLESLTLSGFTRCPARFLGSLKHLALKLPLTHPPIQITTIVNFLAAAPNIEALSLTSFLFVIDNSLPSFKAALPQL